MADVPALVRREVIQRLYAHMDRLRWEEITHREKSDAYERFVNDPEIGGRLTRYIGSDKIRVWIKDGPAKEYGRALEGVGSYASYSTRMYPSPQRFVAQVLGPEWRVRDGSVDDKPMRCWAEADHDSARYVIWGPLTGLKDLVWQAVLHRTDHWDSEPVICVTSRGMTPLPASVRKEAETMCRIVGAEMREARRSVVDKPKDQ
ncbi:hypothetical protein N866_00125 [Actinotalea ferrariae CF5-4]|uniref:Uncharacterized protein n=1 Tax=Actinotalea ferrariae CF5-4 TaxID=948458 RepID=A0A021VVX1_9CELL|nr:hypothetical protein [Actinotalea ferrariae]EYR65311.1 hypothetical protein N866_00125 [Actinotalea ferrariae CF5-4]